MPPDLRTRPVFPVPAARIRVLIVPEYRYLEATGTPRPVGEPMTGGEWIIARRRRLPDRLHNPYPLKGW